MLRVLGGKWGIEKKPPKAAEPYLLTFGKVLRERNRESYRREISLGNGVAPNVSVKGARGSGARTRTADKVVNSHLLYQLSYRGSARKGL